MQPTSLSASAALAFEECAAGYKASYIDRVPEFSMQTAGALGSACHEALEFWVSSGQYLAFDGQDISARNKAMAVVWEMAYWNWFTDRSRYEEGYQLLLKWIQNTSWKRRTVLETEVKKTFEVMTSKGPVPFTYIIDRKDRLESGIIEVIDYKTWIRPIQPADLRDKIQARGYALAVMVEHRDEQPEKVKVTFDQLRYDPVSVTFNREECADTYRYIQALLERIYKSDGTEETLNPGCRFCVRANVCDALRKHEQIGGALGITTLQEATHRLAQLESAKGGIDSALAEVQEVALTLAEQEGELEWTQEGYKAKVTASGRRDVNGEAIAKIIGPEIMSRYGKLNVGLVEAILKDEPLTDSQKSQIKSYITKNWGKAYVKVTPVTDFKEND